MININFLKILDFFDWIAINLFQNAAVPRPALKMDSHQIKSNFLMGWSGLKHGASLVSVYVHYNCIENFLFSVCSRIINLQGEHELGQGSNRTLPRPVNIFTSTHQTLPCLVIMDSINHDFRILSHTKLRWKSGCKSMSRNPLSTMSCICFSEKFLDSHLILVGYMGFCQNMYLR